ncbi:unannotated protein [freshwater metagenome]|uniref:Unannotated protein n=1 Tax=freshwater metagenome TaxID=449393 RepID=A0A6J6LSV1_9ZZZZ
MSGRISAVSAPFKAMRSVASRTARIALVASLMFAFDIAFPDRNWTISSSEASTYTLTFDSNGGSAVEPVSWTAGATLTLPTPTRAGYTFNGWSTRAVGSQLVYQTTNANRSGNSIVYTAGFGRGGSDAAAVLTSQGTTFDRVRYRMEANYSGTLRFADVAFDKWNANLTLAQLAVPDLADLRVIKTNVTNMHVQSNWNAVAGTATAVTSGSGRLGRVEFWPYNYGPETGGVTPAGNGSVYDSDDTHAGASNYGSFQVHNITNSHTVFAWNNHSNSGNPDIGFGNYLGSHPDWTFAGRTNFDLSSWKMQIFIGDLMLGGSTYSPMTNASFTLFAQWTPNTSTVSYNYNNATGGNSVANATFTTGNSPLTLPTPTRTNFVFEGWYSDSGFTNLVGGGGAPYSPTSSGTLFAKWMTNQGAFSITNAPTQLGFSRTVTLGVSGGSGTGGVVFATTSPSVCSVNANSGVVTMLASSGTCSIAATKAADNSFYATSANASITAIKATQTALSITGANSGVFGSTLNLATSGGSTNGQVAWSAGSSTACTISSSGVVSITSGTGTCSVTATMAGSNDYEPVSSASFGVNISKANQTALTIVDTEVTFGQTLSLVVAGGSGTGALTWEEVSGTCTISGTTLTVGSAGSACVIRARRAGDSNYNLRVSADTTINVVRASQSGFSITNTNSFVTGSSLSLSATGGQTGGVVTWSVVSGVCTLSGTALSASRGGVSCVVSATRAGNTNYLAITDSVTITVDKIAQTLSFRTAAPTQAIVGETHTVAVDSSAFLAASITVTNQSQSVCSISAGVVTFLSAGNCVVSASQAGTDVYASAAISQTISVVTAPQSTLAPQAGSSSPSNSIPAPVVKPDTSKPLPVASTIATTTTTTTTTTTIPVDPTQPQMGEDGLVPSLEVGESTAFIRGQEVAVSITQIENALLLTLPNDVRVRIGRVQPSSDSVSIAADGGLRMYRNDTVDVDIQGFVPGTTYTVFMFSEPLELGRGVTDAEGQVARVVGMPKDVSYGDHTLQIVGVGPDGEIVSVSLGFEVLERTSNTFIVVLSLGAAVLLALLGGRPIFTRRRRQSQA